MTEQIVVVVVLSLLNGVDSQYMNSREQLTDWATARSLMVSPLISEDDDEARFANIVLSDDESVEELIRSLSKESFVESAYLKPGDDLP